MSNLNNLPLGAYKYADGRKIDGKRVLVDVERGRTVKGWRPRRLGGGLGNSRRAPSPIRQCGPMIYAILLQTL